MGADAAEKVTFEDCNANLHGLIVTFGKRNSAWNIAIEALIADKFREQLAKKVCDALEASVSEHMLDPLSAIAGVVDIAVTAVNSHVVQTAAEKAAGAAAALGITVENGKLRKQVKSGLGIGGSFNEIVSKV